jgi:predicted nicotinamide N-methyase
LIARRADSDEGMAHPADFIRARLPAMPVPGVEAIRLHLAQPSSGLRHLVAREGAEAPYWAYLWAGGLALARYLIDNPGSVAGRRVLDLGAGSGLVGISAAKAGARSVIAAETDGNGCAAVALNAALNGLSLSILPRDITGEAVPDVDVILVGDLFYADDLAGRVMAFLDRACAVGIDVLVGDPGRRPLPLSRLHEVARYDVAEAGSRIASSGVFRFMPPLSGAQDKVFPRGGESS